MAMQAQWWAQGKIRHLTPVLENKAPCPSERISTGTASTFPLHFWLSQGVSQRGAVQRGMEQAAYFCTSSCASLRPRQKQSSQPGQTRCLLSLIAALRRAPVSQNGTWLLPLHRIVSSHSPAPAGFTAFPLQLPDRLCLAGSVSPLTSQHCLLSFPPLLHSNFPFFIPCPSVLPYVVFCTKVHSTVGLQRRDAKVSCPLWRLASISFTLSSVLMGHGGPKHACLVGMRGALCGPGAWLDNGSTVLEKAALSGCCCALHPLSMWEGNGVPPLPCVLLSVQNQGEDGGMKARDWHHPAPSCAVKAGDTLQGVRWPCICQVLAGLDLGPLLCYRLPQEPWAGPLGHANAL